MAKQTKKEKSEQLLLGTAEDGFVRPLRETDVRYLEANKKYTAVAGRLIATQEAIKETKEEALAPVKDELKELTTRLDALEQLYAYRKIQAHIEEARIRSLEENAVFVVCVISVKLAKSDWCFVCSIPDYLDKCGLYGSLNVFKVATLDRGRQEGAPEEEAVRTTYEERTPVVHDEDEDEDENAADEADGPKEGAA